VWDRFDNTWLEEYRGLSLNAAVRKAEAEGRPVRVVRPDSILSADLSFNRLNVHVNAAGDVQGLGVG